MLGLRFDRRDGGQHRGAVEAGGHVQIGQHGAPSGQGAGFVHGHDAGGFELLQRLALAQQHAQLRRAAGADHDGGGRGQPHGTGAGDDEHGHGIHHAQNSARAAAPTATRPER